VIWLPSQCLFCRVAVLVLEVSRTVLSTFLRNESTKDSPYLRDDALVYCGEKALVCLLLQALQTYTPVHDSSRMIFLPEHSASADAMA
jgi:hypothetical protein